MTLVGLDKAALESGRMGEMWEDPMKVVVSALILTCPILGTFVGNVWEIPRARESRIINDVRQKCIVGLCVGVGELCVQNI